ncbi:MAG: DNA-processing protein DprA, partial [Bacteroidaceae bacterium]|nr:DNA-processing protein DprA [Bacteroidaceae bacterium]
MEERNLKRQLSILALTRVRGLGAAAVCAILRTVEHPELIFENLDSLDDIIPNAGAELRAALSDHEPMERAKAEQEFIEEKGIRAICLGDDDYPYRLSECDDAPPVIYTLGNANLNAQHIVSVVGTRRATEYGKDLCSSLVSDLARLLPGTLIVSGLAYGIDVCAHRAAIKCGLPTLGVLAHGLDRIYPSSHRSVAKEMLKDGGLLSEYMSKTEPFRSNFLQRNRIVAGLADATVVVESPSHGGSLVTSSIAQSYARDCFAFPGRVNDQFSIGCNELIARNSAALITSAHDLIEAMNWSSAVKGNAPVEQELFPQLSRPEQELLDLLRVHSEGLQINQIVIALDISVSKIMPVLFELEMKNLIRAVAGGNYRAIV